MYILGISGQYHDASAALLHNGRIVAAIEEEKLIRVKHAGMDHAGGLPYAAIAYCLREAGITVADLDYAAYYLQPQHSLHRRYRFSEGTARLSYREPGDRQFDNLNEYRERMRTHRLLEELLCDPSRVTAVDHQMAHGAGAFYLSGFDRAAILVLGGKGDAVTISVGVGEGRHVRLIERIEFPDSLGWIYSLFTEYIGFRANGGEHKTQWLSVDGEPEFADAFEDLIKSDKRARPRVDLSYFHSLDGALPFGDKFYRRFGDRMCGKGRRFDRLRAGRRAGTDEFDAATGSYRRNLAHSLQRHLEAVVCALVEKLRIELKVDALCLGGGVALNNLLLSRLERESGYRRIFAQPAAGNSGCSLGAALHLKYGLLGGAGGRKGNPQPLEHVHLGPEYSEHEIKPVLDNCKLTYRYILREDSLLDETVSLLAAGGIVAWFQGRAEFGPRSLGARSILAAPANVYARENLSFYVKRRDAFAPFAVSIPAERAGAYFERSGEFAQYLLSIARAKPEKRDAMRAALFGGGLVRLHTVDRRVNPRFWRLLEKFGERTGHPILLNTSFNLFGEPIVCDPREAVRAYFCSGIDAMAINRFILSK